MHSRRFIYEYTQISRKNTTNHMKLTIIVQRTGEIHLIDVSKEIALEDLRALIQHECNIPIASQILILNDVILDNDTRSLEELRVSDDDIITVKINEKREDLLKAATKFRLSSLSNSTLNDLLRQSFPELYLTLNTPDRFREQFASILEDPWSEDSGILNRLLEFQEYLDYNEPSTQEHPSQQEIDDNLQLAYDIAPESFVPVNLLYIKMRINGHETYALVDSGAQKTIIHPKLAERFGISNLIDKRFAAMTMGIGTKKSEGRIHSVSVSMGETNIDVPCSFTVLDVHIGILFGLDMLKSHKCSIDLSQDALIVNDQAIKFLSDYEIEKNVLPFQQMLSGSTDISNKINSSKSNSFERPKPEGTERSRTLSEESNRINNSSQAAYPESSIFQITSLGFSREQAIAALKLTNGNVELAASSLF